MTRKRTGAFIAALLAVVVIALLPVLYFRSQSSPVSVAATGLAFPRGFTWDDSGTLYVALAGATQPDDIDLTGERLSAETDSKVEEAHGASIPSYAGAVVTIDDRGCPVAYATDLPAAHQGTGWYQSVSGLVFLDGKLYASIDGGGPARSHPEQFPAGIYEIREGGFTPVGNFSTWIPANPVSRLPGDLSPDGEPYGILTNGTSLFVSESNHGQIIQWDADAGLSRLADMSQTHPIPTGPSIDADGNIYVGALTAAPYADGSATVYQIKPDGTFAEIWSGLTMVTATAVGPDGSLYALEMSTDNDKLPPFMKHNTGRVVKMTGPDSYEVIATGLDQPVDMAFGPDGALYVSGPGLSQGLAQNNGWIIRLDLGQADGPIAIDPKLVPINQCAAIPGVNSDPKTLAMSLLPTYTPMPTPTLEPDAPPTATPVPLPTAIPGNTFASDIIEFAYTPPVLTVKTGTTVTWTNKDPIAHTVTANDLSWDSGDLQEGQSWSHTFDTPGQIPYNCPYHPGMSALLIVEE